MTLKHVGKNVIFSQGVVFSHANISIGDNVRFGLHNSIGLVDFGNDIIVAQHVDFLSGAHQHGDKVNTMPFWKQPGEIKRIKIGNNIWIGAQCVIVTNVSNNTIIGSGSVVTKTFKSGNILAGNPATILRELT
jgi:acetyltransferase-like isoleucine patch superfamily enzyme